MKGAVTRLGRAAWIFTLIAANLVIATGVHLLWAGPVRDARAGLETVSATASEEEQVIAAVERAVPAVVSILVQEEIDVSVESLYGGAVVEKGDGDSRYLEVGRGTGFLISAGGMIVTNRHVVMDRNHRLIVFLSDGSRHEARVLDIDPVNDLALIAIEGTGYPVLDLAADDDFRVGQTTIAIGNALGKFENTVTRGVLSGVGRSIEATDYATGEIEVLDEVLQTDAAINSGNSGGPLMDLDGRVIGVNTAVDHDAQGLGFAIPVSEIRKVLSSYLAFGSIARPRLGVRYVAITPDLVEREGLSREEGAWITEGEYGESPVVFGSPAQAVGLEAGDIVFEVDGVPLEGRRNLSRAIQSKQVGDRVTLKVDRGGTVLELIATLDAHPPYGL